MTDILVYGIAGEGLLAVERVINDKDMRAKVTSEREVCESWIDARDFSLAFIDAGVGITLISTLSERIWQKNPDCRVVTYDIKGEPILEPLLLGAETVGADKALQFIAEAVDDIKAKKEEETVLEHILVVEDLDSPRDIICMFLEGLGYSRVTGVGSAAEAIDRLTENPNSYTAVLTDIKMPSMTGDQLIQYIRRTEGLDRIPVVVLTAYGTPDCLVDCLRAGATGFLVKPPKKPDLKRELNRAHRVRRSGAPVRLVAEDQVDSLYDLLANKGLV